MMRHDPRIFSPSLVSLINILARHSGRNTNSNLDTIDGRRQVSEKCPGQESNFIAQVLVVG